MFIQSRNFICITFLIIFGGCTVGPSIEKINAFGGAVSTVSGQLQEIRELNLSAAQTRADLNGLDIYLDREVSDFPILNEPETAISDDLLKVRADALDALTKYGNALATLKTTDTSELTEAVDGLVASATNFAAASGFSIATVPLIGPATELIGTGVGLLVRQANEKVILEEIRRAHPHVKKLSELLDEETKIISTFLDTKLNSIEGKHRTYLKLVRRNTIKSSSHLKKLKELEINENRVIIDPDENFLPRLANSTDIATQRNEYYRVIQELNALHAELKNVKKVQKLIGNMLNAHKSLKDDMEDTSALVEFLDAVSKLNT